jgi:hypothetical protein
MLLPLMLALTAGAGPAAGTSDGILTADGGVCLATGYCAVPDRGRAPTAGIMYLALGLVGTGVTVLRTGRHRVTTEQ